MIADVHYLFIFNIINKAYNLNLVNQTVLHINYKNVEMKQFNLC